jgi:hypothetical protein
LLREIVKFRTYIESLNAASIAKDVVLARRAERDAELAVIRSNAAAAVTAATVAAADEAATNSTEHVEAFDEDLPEDFDETADDGDLTPRHSAMPVELPA